MYNLYHPVLMPFCLFVCLLLLLLLLLLEQKNKGGFDLFGSFKQRGSFAKRESSSSSSAFPVEYTQT